MIFKRQIGAKPAEIMEDHVIKPLHKLSKPLHRLQQGNTLMTQVTNILIFAVIR